MKVIRKYREFLEDTLATSDFAILQGGKRAGNRSHWSNSFMKNF